MRTNNIPTVIYIILLVYAQTVTHPMHMYVCMHVLTFAHLLSGAGLAWAAKTLGHRAVVYLPQGAAASRVARIQSLGAEAIVTDLSYDDAVTLSARKAEENGWVLIQDTAWKGYTEVRLAIIMTYY
jgi:hypothetical protein